MCRVRFGLLEAMLTVVLFTAHTPEAEYTLKLRSYRDLWERYPTYTIIER